MPIVASFVLPHPPIVLPEVGRGEEAAISKTIEGFEQCADMIARLAPETIIIISPHSALYAHSFYIYPGQSVSGTMSRFGAQQLKMDIPYDEELAESIARRASTDGVSVTFDGKAEKELDHGCFIPLYFINKRYSDYKLVRLGLSGLSPIEHYRMGEAIEAAVTTKMRRCVVIASCDLSHKLKVQGPYGFAPEGPVFDKRVVDDLRRADFLDLLSIDGELSGAAAECGLRSL